MNCILNDIATCNVYFSDYVCTLLLQTISCEVWLCAKTTKCKHSHCWSSLNSKIIFFSSITRIYWLFSLQHYSLHFRIHSLLLTNLTNYYYHNHNYYYYYYHYYYYYYYYYNIITVEPDPCATTSHKRPPIAIQNTNTFPVKALHLEPLVNDHLL